MTPNFSSNSFPSLAALVHRTVLRAPSGMDAQTISEVAGYNSYNTMMSELSRQSGHKLGADMLLPLMDATESNAPLEFLARERGGVFLVLPEPAKGGDDLVISLADSIREFGEFAAETAKHVEDGDLPRDQFESIRVRGYQAASAIMAILKLARVTHEAQYGGGK